MTDDKDDLERRFLTELHARVGGDLQGHESMYVVGAALGLEKVDARSVAEALMGDERIEIRTLSGEIGLTEKGAAAAAAGEDGIDLPDAASRPLRPGTVLTEEEKKRINQVAADVKKGIETLDSFVRAELDADVDTVSAQLCSPKAKSDILIACFRSIKNALSVANGDSDLLAKIDRLLIRKV